MLLDGTPIAIGFALFLMATARPVLSGIGIAALGFGLGLVDVMKRKILREPVMFADRAELIEVARHPRFYISFVGTVPMLAGTAALIALVAALVWAEPPLWHVGPLLGLGLLLWAVVLGRLAFVVPGRPFFSTRLAALYERWQPTRDPALDQMRFGLLACVVLQATIARAERLARQAAARAADWPAMPKGQGPIILWQAESFVDATRLDPSLTGRLPAIERLRGEALLAGRIDVPAWGANTIRTEFAAITGLGEKAIGLDRFNPYERFAQLPLPSLATLARAAGYRTICVHPYTASFYARHRVMPNLGFDRFIQLESFGDADRDGGYVTDVALARFVADLVRTEGPDLFLFVISIENHGPWDAKHDGHPPAALPPAWAALPSAAELGRWLRHIEATDGAVAILREALEQQGQGWFGFYGDHQPSIAGPFDEGRQTDYWLWRVGARGGAAVDLAAEDLARRLLGLMGVGL